LINITYHYSATTRTDHHLPNVTLVCEDVDVLTVLQSLVEVLCCQLVILCKWSLLSV